MIMNLKGASIPKNPVSRIAPTPSGFLHIGNAYNFILTWWTTKWLEGKIHLRIDDADSARTRPEYLEDIFETLDWLGLDYDFGPKNLDDFMANHSQTNKKERYFKNALSAKAVFACDCSRKEIQELSPQGIYPGTCARKASLFKRHIHALRIHVPEEEKVQVGDQEIQLGKSMGDFVLWRKDDIPSYQLTSVVDDRDLGVNLVVRGKDLLESSAAQLFLEKRLGWSHLQKSVFIHHDLLKDETGKKLSKSQAGRDEKTYLKTMRDGGLKPKDILTALAAPLGLEKEAPRNLGELLKTRPKFLS